MSGGPSLIQQREAKQLIKAARQAGAKQVEVTLPNGTAVIVHLDAPPEDKPQMATWDEAVAKLESK